MELKFIPWVARVNEKITFILLNLKEKRDITEEDYDLLEFFHKHYHQGEFPLYKTQMEGTNQVVTQGGLFTDITANDSFVYANGTVVDNIEEVTIT